MTEEQPTKQIAALPTRKRRGKLEILLITSRETKRWVIPKGWPIAGLTTAAECRADPILTLYANRALISTSETHRQQLLGEEPG